MKKLPVAPQPEPLNLQNEPQKPALKKRLSKNDESDVAFEESDNWEKKYAALTVRKNRKKKKAGKRGAQLQLLSDLLGMQS